MIVDMGHLFDPLPGSKTEMPITARLFLITPTSNGRRREPQLKYGTWAAIVEKFKIPPIA
jgi:hypothetical protein